MDTRQQRAVTHPSLSPALLLTYILFTQRRVGLSPVMIVFHVLPLLLRDSAFRMPLQVGCFFGAVERGWSQDNGAGCVVSNAGE